MTEFTTEQIWAGKFSDRRRKAGFPVRCVSGGLCMVLHA